MRTLNSTILAQLQAKELRPFLILDMDLDGTHVRYTDCDVPLGVRYKYEAITGGPTVHGLSLADGAAFVRLNGLDLSPFAGVAGVRTPCKLTLTDSAGKQAVGWIAEADAAEAFSAEKVTNSSFATDISDWTNDGVIPWATCEWGVTESIHLAAGAAGTYCSCYSLDNIVITPFKLYQVEIVIRSISNGTLYVTVSETAGGVVKPFGDLAFTSAGTYTYNLTAIGGDTCQVFLWRNDVGSANLDAVVDSVSIKEITHVGADGVHIVSAQNGSTRNWASIEAGFNYNDTAYTAEIGNVRFSPRGMKFEPIRYSTGRVVDSMKVQIDNLDDALTVYFVGGTPQGGTVTLQAVLLDSAYEMVAAPLTLFEGTLDGWDLDEEKVSLTVASELVRWNQKTLAKHSPSCRWKEFKGTECAYAGAETWCDRTYTRCAALGNQANFGGFRWLPSIQEKEIWWGKNRAI